MTHTLWIEALEQDVEIEFRMEQYEQHDGSIHDRLTEFEWNQQIYTETQNIIIASEIELQKDNILSTVLDDLKDSI